MGHGCRPPPLLDPPSPPAGVLCTPVLCTGSARRTLNRVLPPDPPSLMGRGSLATCWDIEHSPGPVATYPGWARQQVLPLDTALLAPGIRRHFTLRPDPPDQTLWWSSRCGMSWRAARVAPTCPDGCATVAGAPQRCHQSWLRHRQLVIGKRSPESQALRSAGLAGAGTATPRIDHPCMGREWGRR